MAKKIKVTKNGPYLVSGNIPLDKAQIIGDAEGTPTKWEFGENFPAQENYALCRCGQSKNKPFCDGSHIKANFDGTETASRKPCLDQSETTIGPDLDLVDVEPLCAIARFCHRAGDTWTLTEHSDDPKSKATAIQEACDCPSGRLIAREKQTGKLIEPEFTPSISVVEDTVQKVSGPLWAKGGIPIEAADGFQYEVRNRVTLCRCGRSKNKPYCDGTHIDIKFNDGDKSLNI
ncbi:MAG: CDGSH iron-sulfur domain-containing protein [Candidatus Margulisiibacteriota bacterium]